jgi:predicted AAA+ superfamily ATPase
MIARLDYRQRVEKALTRNPIVALLGARQVGKTTLAREFVPLDSANYLDLEDPFVTDLMENPMTALQGLRGLVVIDEAQRQPKIFPALRVLADRPDARHNS